MEPSWKFSRADGLMFRWLGVFLLICGLYYFSFSADLVNYSDETGVFQFALNYHDHLVYLNNISNIEQWGTAVGMNNDFGIAMIYIILLKIFPFISDPELIHISFMFNCIVLCLSYFVYIKICNHLALGNIGKLVFFLNFSLIYFAQLINKDMLTTFIFMLIIYWGQKKKYRTILWMLPLFVLVRQQLAIFSIIFIVLMTVRRPGRQIVFLYISTSLLAGYLSVFYSIIGDDSLGNGLSSFLVDFNKKYYIGYLLFNPLRIIQFFADLLNSFMLFTKNGGVDTAKLLRIPQVILLLILTKQIGSMVTRFSHWIDTPAKSLVMGTCAYFLTWLMNPTINARYVILITPVWVLFGLFVYQHTRKRPLGKGNPMRVES